MIRFIWRRPARAAVLGLAFGLPGPILAQTLPSTPTPDTSPVEEVVVTARRLNQARDNIQPSLGASTYKMDAGAIAALPGGQDTPIDQVILQAPGVDQDSLANGGLHVRNEHLNVQYRINGVILPDGVSFFGQAISTRFIDSLSLVTGALPAQYGLRTAGIVDIRTKDGTLDPGGEIGISGGSFGTIEPSLDYGGSSGRYTYFASADYQQSDRGVEAPTAAYNALHDSTLSTHGFAYLDRIIDPSSKVSLMLGTFNSQFQIPNNPGQATLTGISAINGVPITDFNSAALHEYQTESSQFGVLSYLRTQKDVDIQVSVFSKYSALQYHPDNEGDLAFDGIAEAARRTSVASGLQADGTWRLAADHTLRAGALMTVEHVASETMSDVLAQTGTDASGNPVYATTTTTIPYDTEKTGYTYTLYAQDEWAPVEHVTVNYGVRFDVVNGYTEGNQWSPRLNTVWIPREGTTIHAGYASYFTPPPLELVSTGSLAAFNNTSAAATPIQSSPIKNERAQYLDLGALQSFGHGFSVGLDLYYKYSRNLLDEGQFGAPVILTPFNYHVGYNRGVELTTNYADGPFTYYGNLAIAEQKAEGVTSAQALFGSLDDLAYADSHLINTDHSQRMTASAGIAYQRDGTSYSVDILAGTGVRTTNPGDAVNQGTVPSYEQVNLGLTHRFETAPGGPVTLRLTVLNLLDERYLLRSQSGIGVFANQYATPRSAYAALIKEF